MADRNRDRKAKVEGCGEPSFLKSICRVVGGGGGGGEEPVVLKIGGWLGGGGWLHCLRGIF